jgi:hypothetical protein
MSVSEILHTLRQCQSKLEVLGALVTAAHVDAAINSLWIETGLDAQKLGEHTSKSEDFGH